MKKEIKKIARYVKNQLKKVCKENSLELFEIILLPEIPFYLIARLNAPRGVHLTDKRLDELETKLLGFQKVGIRCIIRPRGFKISNKILDEKILKRSAFHKRYRIPKLSRYPIFGDEIKTLNKEIRNYFGLRKNVFFWEIEINLKQPFLITAHFFSKKKIISSKKDALGKLEIRPYSNFKMARILLDLTYIAALKRKSLLRFLLLDNENGN